LIIGGIGSGFLVFLVVYLLSHSSTSGFEAYFATALSLYVFRMIQPFIWRRIIQKRVSPSKLSDFFWFSRGYFYGGLIVLIAAALL
jgi:hypothetical protein